MRSATPEELRDAQKAFVDVETPDLITVDRSTLERASVCPFQARAISDGRCSTVGVLAVASEAVHQAFGRTIHEYIDSGGAMGKTDLRESSEFEARNCRPDLQPEVMRIAQSSLWGFSQLLGSVHPGNVLAFDGGEDIDRSGQLAIDFPDLGVRYTSEVDLLYQSDNPEIGEEVDYKLGWKDWTAEDIRDSFQFQSHAVMALEKYPQWKALRVRIFDRKGRLTFPVYFQRERLFDWKVRIRKAIEAWQLSQSDDPPTWPTLEKCGQCPAACLCPVADQPIADLAADPPGFVKRLVAVEARAEAMRKLAAAHVDSTGQDIQADGVWFGRRKPASSRKPNATIYTLKGESHGDHD